jgi:hypothetical protein
MATRAQGDFGFTDYTPLLALKPRSQNLLQELGIFSEMDEQLLTGDNAEFERENKGLTAMHNVARGADRQFAGDEEAQIELFKIPFASLDKITKPHEVAAFREYGTEDAPATVESLVERRIEHIQRSHARYIRNCMYHAITDNEVYAFDKAGNKLTSLAKNYSTVWGAARNTDAIDLTDAATDPFIALEAARKNIIDKAGDDADGYDVLYLVGSNQFSQIVSHPLVEAAYENYSSDQEPLRKRLNGNNNNRIFRHKGILVVEDISSRIDDVTGGATAKGYVIPLGIPDLFSGAYGPADTIDAMNGDRIAEKGYLFMEEGRRSVKIESEVAYMAMITRPELLTTVTTTLA